MSRVRLSFAALLVVSAVFVSCTDRPAPTEVARPLARGVKGAAGTCTTIPQLKTLATTVFGARNEFLHDALDNISDIGEYVAEHHIADAQKKATWLVGYIQQHASTFANRAQAQTLIDGINCYVGLSTDAFLVFPSDQPQTIISSTGQAGIVLPANPVTQPTLITVTQLDPNAPSPLITKLDKYPGYIVVTQVSGVANSLTVPVTVAVCPSAGIPDSIRSRLRLGHQAAAGFEVTPPADGSFLTCAPGIASIDSKLPGWMRSLASLVLPRTLYARMRSSGGIGGTATEFSPFGPVDPVLSFSGGIGGTATEFQRAPSDAPLDPETAAKTSHTKSSVESAVAMAHAVNCGEATVGSAVVPECRPLVTLKTFNGTILQNVPVTWAIGQGGGQTAMDSSASRACGAFGSTASTTTNVNGRAGACWTIGAVAGTNTLIATPHAGGDVPAGVTFVPPADTFTVIGLKNQATLSLGGLSQGYDGTAKSVTVTTAPTGLNTVSVTYNGSATAPTDGGSYAVVATLTNPSYEGTVSGTLVIARAAQSALTVTGPSTATYGDAAVQLAAIGGNGTGALTFAATGSTACSVSATGLLTITSGTGTCAVTATKADDGNYSAVSSPAFAIAINKASTTIVLANLGATYDGAAKSATASTTPALAGITMTYDGSATLPSNAGSYAVAATLADPNYAAAVATGTLVIGKANQSALMLTAPAAATYGGGTVQVNATGGAGTGSVTFDASLTPAACSVNAASGQVTILSGTGSCVVSAARAGDGNYNAGTAATVSIALSKATQSITFTAIGAKTYGDAAFTASATSSAALPVTITVGAGSACAVAGSIVTLSGAGSCTLTASQGGDASYYAAAAPVTQTVSIAKRSATATAGSGAMPVGGTVPALPCTVSGLLAGDAGAVTCTTVVPGTLVSGANVTTASITPVNPANYAMLAVNGTLTVTGYGQQGCFASPISNSLTPPPTSSGVTKGTRIVVSCRLVDANGRAVGTAKGNLLVQDRGTNGLTTPGATVFTGTNVFTAHDDGDNSADDGVYTYSLSTSTGSFIKGHYYFVTATWNDGSTTKGWIYLKP